MPVVIVAYSGGYLPAAYSLAHGGARERIKGVVLLDALYGEPDKFARWIEQERGHAFFVSAYSDFVARRRTTRCASGWSATACRPVRRAGDAGARRRRFRRFRRHRARGFRQLRLDQRPDHRRPDARQPLSAPALRRMRVGAVATRTCASAPRTSLFAHRRLTSVIHNVSGCHLPLPSLPVAKQGHRKKRMTPTAGREDAGQVHERSRSAPNLRSLRSGHQRIATSTPRRGYLEALCRGGAPWRLQQGRLFGRAPADHEQHPRPALRQRHGKSRRRRHFRAAAEPLQRRRWR